jgi:hypothetical protein
MAAKKPDEATEAVVELKQQFNKEQIIKSKKYRESADIVGALLRDGESYTFKQVDKALDDFMKKEIKTC